MSDQDLLRYYKVLKQFLDISDDTASSTRNKSNSSRAQRAREKLLKLSSAQFKELSTDVYDELRRRIDESRTEPDFLLPKLTFHPKRNQARQKLSSLPQSRFKDLVSDISFEIVRRNLHTSTHSALPDSNATTPTRQQWPSQDQATSDRDQKPNSSLELGASSYPQPGSAEHDQDLQHPSRPNSKEEPLLKDLATPKIDNGMGQKTIAVQPTTVIPTKANLAWSSDEEAEEEQEGDRAKERFPTETEIEENKPYEEEVIRRISLSNGFAPKYDASASSSATQAEKQIDFDETTMARESDLRLQLTALEERNKQLEGDLVSLREKHNELLENHENETTAKKNLESQFFALKQQQATQPSQQEHSFILQELESLKSANAAVLLENQALKESQKDFRTSNTKGKETTQQSREVNADLGKLKEASFDQAVDINSQLEKLIHKMDSLPPQIVDTSSISKLQSEATEWRKRYESIKAGNISSAIQINQSGSKDIKRYLTSSGEVPLQTASNFFASIESFVLSLNSENLDNDSLFENMSRITLAANKIASYGHKKVFSDDVYSGFVREAAGHALTATRYFASYRQLLPKVVVERAVAEIAFAVCDFIARFKLIDNSGAEIRGATLEKIFLKDSDELNKNSNSPVRELKIASKLLSAHNPDFSGNIPKSGDDADSKSTVVPHEPSTDVSVKNVSLRDENQRSVRSGLVNSVGDKPRNEVPEISSSTALPREENPTSISFKDDDSKGSLIADSKGGLPRGESPVRDLVAESTVGDVVSREVPRDGAPEHDLNQNVKLDNNRQLEQDTISFNLKVSPDPSQTNAKKFLFERLQNSEIRNSSMEIENKKEVVKSGETEAHGTDTVSNSKSSPETPKKSSILERVRQFDTPQESKSVSPITPSAVKSTNITLPDGQPTPALHEYSEEEKSPIASSSPKLINAIPTRGKSIFQSLREKFANDKAPQTEENVNGKKETSLTENTSVTEKNEYDRTSIKTAIPSESTQEYKRGDEYVGADDNLAGSNEELNDEVEALNIGRIPSNPSINDLEAKHLAASTKTSKVVDSKPEPVSFQSNVIPGSFGDQPKVDSDPSNDGSFSGESIYEEENEEPLSKVIEPVVLDTPLKPQSDEKPIQKSMFSSNLGFKGIPVKAPSFKVKKVNYAEDNKESDGEYGENDNDDDELEENEEEEEARQRQEYRKSMAAATFNFDLFDIDDPDNTLTQVLLYLEHQTVQVITTIQDLLSAIKRPDSTRGELRENSMAISEVIRQMTEATNTSMNQTRNFQLKEHGSWVVKSLEDCNHRMNTLCRANTDRNDRDFADKNFKQRLAGISFDIAKCTKELVKTVEEASLKEDIAHLDARLHHQDDLT